MEILGGSFGTDVKVAFGYHWWHTDRLTKIQIYGRQNKDYVHWAYEVNMVSTVQMLSQSNQATVGRGIGGAAIGAVVAGPIGLIAGAVIGSHKNRQLLAITFTDGNQLLVYCKAKETKVWLSTGRLVA